MPIRTIIALCLIGTSDTSELQAIRKTFESYKAALLAKNGQKAEPLVDRGTIDSYGELRRLALEGDAATVKKQPMIDRLIIVRMRHQVGAGKLRKLDAAGAFRLGIDSGWVGDESVKQQSLGKITVNGDTARAPLLVGGRKTPFQHAFHKEDGTWKLDVAAMTRSTRGAFEKLAKDSGMTENDFIVYLVSTVSGKDVPASIWDKPGSAPPKREKRAPLRRRAGR
jgi:hypothetical protein